MVKVFTLGKKTKSKTVLSVSFKLEFPLSFPVSQVTLFMKYETDESFNKHSYEHMFCWLEVTVLQTVQKKQAMLMILLITPLKKKKSKMFLSKHQVLAGSSRLTGSTTQDD